MQQQARFRIFATVRGGVTGYRTSFVKRDGAVLEFTDRSAAQEHAAYLSSAMNHPNAKAAFTYEAVALPPHAA